jgi:hypothetical protein
MPPSHRPAAHSAPGVLPSFAYGFARSVCVTAFCWRRPQRLDVQRLVGPHLLQPSVFIFQLPTAANLALRSLLIGRTDTFQR